MNTAARTAETVVYDIADAPRPTTASVVHTITAIGTAGSVQPLPGAELVTLPGGERVMAYVEPREALPAAPMPVGPLIPRWAAVTALLAPTLTGSFALGAWGLGLAVEAVAGLAAALRDLAAALAVIAIVLFGGTAVIRALLRGATGTGSGEAAATATATSTSRSLFVAKSTATASATAIARK